MYKNLEEFLRNKANKELKKDNEDWYSTQYIESINKDAITDDWLDNNTTYIYNVGVLALWDSNKCDYAYAFIGHQRNENQNFQFIGMLKWKNGENDDIGRSLAKYVELLTKTHPIFIND